MGKQLKKDKPLKFLHLVDHDGTIFQLVSPLTVYPDHKILTSFSCSESKLIKLMNKMSKNKELIVILHATGNRKYFYSLKRDLLKKFNRFYIFLHVSPKHFLIKNRMNEIVELRKLTKKYNLRILTTSKELKKEYFSYGLKAIPIQIGINFDKDKFHIMKQQSKKYITTVCTSEDRVYNYIKGIDRFYKLVRDLGLEEEAVILGNKSDMFKGIISKRVSQKNFLKYLLNSKVYIQLSRTEAYNLSAVYAKLLKIPVIVSDVEGHKDNMRYGFRIKNLNEAKLILGRILSNPKSPKIKKVIEKNYQDSLKRETLNNFRNSLNKLWQVSYTTK